MSLGPVHETISSYSHPICHPVRDCELRVDRDRGNRGLDCDPSGDRVQHGRGLHPSSPHNNVRRHDVAQSSELSRRAVESNSLRAICNAFPLDTSSLPPTRLQVLASQGQRQPREEEVALRS